MGRVLYTEILNHLDYMKMAKVLSEKSGCLSKHWGAIIVSPNNKIVGMGYNDAPYGRISCSEIGSCYRITHNIPRGTDYTKCRSLHAEQMAIIRTKNRNDLRHASMYLYGFDMVTNTPVANASSCTMCRRAIIESGIDKLYVYDPTCEKGYRVINVDDWLKNDETLTDNVGY